MSTYEQVEYVATQRQIVEFAAEREAVRSHYCEDCGAEPGVRCTNRNTGLLMIEKVPGHLARIKLTWPKS